MKGFFGSTESKGHTKPSKQLASRNNFDHKILIEIVPVTWRNFKQVLRPPPPPPPPPPLPPPPWGPPRCGGFLNLTFDLTLDLILDAALSFRKMDAALSFRKKSQLPFEPTNSVMLNLCYQFWPCRVGHARIKTEAKSPLFVASPVSFPFGTDFVSRFVYLRFICMFS